MTFSEGTFLRIVFLDLFWGICLYGFRVPGYLFLMTFFKGTFC